MIGKVFNNRYQIVEKLGAGGTAIVYRGQDKLLNRAVTIKILREEFVNNNELVRRFRHEAQAVASLSHPNIVSVYDVGYEENMHYIVMEFVEGESLKEYIKRKGPLRLPEACNIITQILAGVQHAHEHGIIHRDIKPHNILLGVDGRAKVTDFGIAVGMSDVTMTYNSTSRIMGSVHYISPEQVQGLPVTDKSDIYSCGVVFYEMLTGRVPYQGETPISIAMQHVQGELILPNQVNPQVPAGISYVVTRAMRRNPDGRYHSASEMAEAVRAAYQSSTEPPVSETAAEAGLTRSAIKRRRPAEPEPVEPEPEPAAAPRKMTPGRIALLVVAVLLLIGVVWAAKTFTSTLMGGGEVPMPSLIGLTQEEAEAALTDLGLVPVASFVVSDTAEAGLVIDQDVDADVEVPVGKEIGFTVSSGSEKITIPDLTVNTSQRIAELTLSNLGLVAEVTTEYNEEVPKDQIIMTSPTAGTEVEPGSTVQLLVSLGPEPTKFSMKNLVGVPLTDAQNWLAQNKLNLVGVSKSTSYEYESGIVLSQTLTAGVTVQSGDEISLVVSEGPGPSSRTYSLSYRVPQEVDEEGQPVESMHTVLVTVNDLKGSRDVYNQQLPAGSDLNCSIDYYNSATITVYVDGAEAYSVSAS